MLEIESESLKLKSKPCSNIRTEPKTLLLTKTEAYLYPSGWEQLITGTPQDIGWLDMINQSVVVVQCQLVSQSFDSESEPNGFGLSSFFKLVPVHHHHPSRPDLRWRWCHAAPFLFRS